MSQQKVLAQYFVDGPKMVKRTKQVHKHVDGRIQSSDVEVEEEVFDVVFPKGHITRMDRQELTRLGFDKRPRLIDAETGDVIERGGDPFDFVDEVKSRGKSRTADAMAA